MSVLYRYIPGTGRVAAIQCGSGSSPTNDVATMYSTSDQSLTANTAAAILYDTVPFSYGYSVSGSTITVTNGGIHKIIPSVQFSGSNNGTMIIWIKVNGSNLTDSSTQTNYKTGDTVVITCEYLLSLNAGDQIQVFALSTTNATIDYIAGGGSGANAYPAAPGIITDIYRLR